MFCVQCEQTIRTPAGNGCSYAQGMCGKTAETSDLQDLLIASLQGLSAWALKAREYGIIDHEVDSFAPRAFFSTLTNVNFDSPRIVGYARQAIALREALKAQCLDLDASAKVDSPVADLQLVGDDLGDLQRQAADYAPNKDKAAIGENILGLRLLCLYGLKGAAAYMEHAHVLGQYDNAIYAQYHKIMAWLGTWPADMNALLECSMEIGQMNFKVMSILDAGETTKYGHPTPTQVNVKATEGKCILISGHDLKDLYNLLEQTEGTGVNVYTHGEMLPAHGYPELRKFKHLIGNYGSGWQNQQVEFARFPGPIVMTSNCIIDPTVGAYDDRIWTRSIVGWPGVNHLEGEDFSPVIAQAQQMAGFPYSEIPHLITVGFGRQTLLGAADTLIDLENAIFSAVTADLAKSSVCYWRVNGTGVASVRFAENARAGVVIGDKHFTLHAGDILTLEGGVATDLSGLVWAVPTALPSQPSWLVDILSASYIGDAPLGAVLTSRLITESRTLRLAESVARLSVAGNGFGVTVRRNGAAVATITYQPSAVVGEIVATAGGTTINLLAGDFVDVVVSTGTAYRPAISLVLG